jgi:hypothetical protein
MVVRCTGSHRARASTTRVAPRVLYKWVGEPHARLHTSCSPALHKLSPRGYRKIISVHGRLHTVDASWLHGCCMVLMGDCMARSRMRHQTPCRRHALMQHVYACNTSRLAVCPHPVHTVARTGRQQAGTRTQGTTPRTA